MLNVTNRSCKFGVQEGRVSRDSHLGWNPVFLPDSTGVLRHFRITHWSCTIIQNGELLALWLQDMAFSTVAQSSQSAGYHSWQSKKLALYCMVTNLPGFFFLFFYISCFWLDFLCLFLRCGDAMLILHSAPQLNPLSGYLERSTEFL